MPLIDQFAFVGVRELTDTNNPTDVWNGPSISGFLINVGATQLSINCTPLNSNTFGPGASIGVRNVTAITILPTPSGGRVACALFYTPAASRDEAENPVVR